LHINYPLMCLLNLKSPLNPNLNHIVIQQNLKVHQYEMLNYYFYNYDYIIYVFSQKLLGYCLYKKYFS
jgi:hypothetical protein